MKASDLTPIQRTLITAINKLYEDLAWPEVTVNDLQKETNLPLLEICQELANCPVVKVDDKGLITHAPDSFLMEDDGELTVFS